MSQKGDIEDIDAAIFQCQTFGPLIKKLTVQFITYVVQQHIRADQEELELMHLREENPGKAGELRLGLSYADWINTTKI